MRLSYFGYYLKNRTTHRRLLVDLTEFLSSFAEFDNPTFKSSLKYNSEHIYLQRLSGTVFLFAMTRDSEKFKRINTSNLDIGEIQNILGQDEKIGFASYLVIKSNFFGFASASLSPKFDTFCNMVNQLLSHTGNGSWEFCSKPLIHQATREEAVSMNYIGKTTIEVSRDNSLFREFFNFFGNISDASEIDSLEITMKPKKNRSIKPIIEKVIGAASDEGIEKLTMKAKNDATSAMLDLYVVGRGVLSDDLGAHDESKIPFIIEEKIKVNSKLSERLQEFSSDDQNEKPTAEDITLCSNVSTWSALAMDLQGDYKLVP